MTPFSSAELQERIRWYCKVRWWYVLAIAAPGITTLVVQYGLANQQVMQNLEITTFALLINTFLYAATYWWPRWPRYFDVLAVLQIVFDLAIMTGAFYFNGGLETPIVMLFCIPILMAGSILGRRAVYVTGFTATTLFAVFSLLDYGSILRPASIAAPQLHTNPNYFFPILILTSSTLLVITVIADFVGRLVRQRSLLATELGAVNVEKAKIEAILKTMGSALVAMDTKGDITLVNDNFEYITGWHRNEVLGKQLDDVLPMIDERGQRVPVQERPTMQMSALGNQSNYHVRKVSHHSYLRRDGTSFPFLSNISPIVLNRQVIGVTNTFDDVTTVQKLEQLKTNFVALVSHQLKTPIGEIQGYVNNMLYGVTGKLTQKQTSYLGEVRDVTERANKLITDLLDITVLERGGLVLDSRSMRLAPVIRQLIKIYEPRMSKRGLAIRVVKPARELTVVADNDKLLEVLGNVLANAIAYSKKGTITIQTKATDGHAEIRVIDQGSGIDKATIAAVFDKDEILSAAPTAEGGTGLGLYLARQLMRMQNGDVRVEKSSSKGTTICITIPLMKG